MTRLKANLFLFFLLVSNIILGQLKSPLQPVGHIASPKDFSEKSHNWFLSKRFVVATNQRDSVYYVLLNLRKQYDKDTTQRGIDFRNLQGEYNVLGDQHEKLLKSFGKLNEDYKFISKKFSDFMESATTNSEKLNIALAQKNKELVDRENRLKELENLIAKQDSISKALKDIIKKALLGFNSQDLSVELKNGKVYISFSDEFLFRSGSADVEEKGLEALKKVSEIINSNAKVDILIEGHTDNVPIKAGKFQDNWDLSAARSLSVVRILNSMYGVNPMRLTAAGRGEFIPKASNETAAGKAKNRRIEIILIPDLSELYDMIYK